MTKGGVAGMTKGWEVRMTGEEARITRVRMTKGKVRMTIGEEAEMTSLARSAAEESRV
jgi:hypothetical protein